MSDTPPEGDEAQRVPAHVTVGSAEPQRDGWMRGTRSLTTWVSGVAAGVLTAAIVAWLVVWGVIPGQGDGEHEFRDGPLSVAVTSIQDPANGLGWVIPDLEPTDLMRVGPDDDLSEFAESAGGVPARSAQVQFTVQGRSEAQVVLTGLRVRVVKRDPPLAGTHVAVGGGGPSSFRWVRADLDTDPPTYTDGLFEPGAESVPPYERRPVRFPYEVSLSDAESFDVIAATERCDCHWVVELAWASEGQTGVLTIDDGGRPFRVTGVANTSAACVGFDSLECADVVNLQGLKDVHFGDLRDDLEMAHGLREVDSGCVTPQYEFPRYPQVRPVFSDDRLVLLWVDPPMRSSVGHFVNGSLELIRSAYPGAQELDAPLGSYDGLLIAEGDRGYLLLHDGKTVRRLVVGFERHLRLVVEDNFSVC